MSLIHISVNISLTTYTSKLMIGLYQNEGDVLSNLMVTIMSTHKNGGDIWERAWRLRCETWCSITFSIEVFVSFYSIHFGHHHRMVSQIV